MKDHYQLTDAEYQKLKLTDMELMKMIPVFDPNGNGLPIGKLGLLYYVDEHGDFTEGFGGTDHKRIARAVFASLPDDKERLEVLQYLTPEEEL